MPKSNFLIIGLLIYSLWGGASWARAAGSCYAWEAAARVAYYHPSSKKVRHIYSQGWPDYQLEISKRVHWNGAPGRWPPAEWRLCGGVSWCERTGDSIGHIKHHTKLQLVPLHIGVQWSCAVFRQTDLFIGGAACYSFLHIDDDSKHVHQHVHKQGWGGLVQSGVTYRFGTRGTVGLFADYLFQSFSRSGSSQISSASAPCSSGSSGYVGQHGVDMSGYKVGAALGVIF